VELTGSSVFDYIHPGDHVEVAEQLGLKLASSRGQSTQAPTEDGASSTSSSSLAETPEPDSASPSLLPEEITMERTFFVRMKSTLTKRGVHIKSSGYKVIHVTGRLRPRLSLPHTRAVPTRFMGMVALAHTLPPSTINEVRIECHMFVSRVSLDLQIIYCENRISDYMDLCTADVVGKNCYHFIHAEDVEGIRHSHLDLLNKGQVVTKYYRWMQKNGGYMWVQSSATISINVKNGNEKNIIWVNHVLSKQELRDTPMDISQLPLLSIKPSKQLELSDSESDSREHIGGCMPKALGKAAGLGAAGEARLEGWKRSGNQSEEEMTSAKDDSDSSLSDSDGPSGVGRRSFVLSRVKRLKVEAQALGEGREQRGSGPSEDGTGSSEEEAAKHQYPKRRKRPRDGSGPRRKTPSPGLGPHDFGGPRTSSERVPTPKVKTEAIQPVGFDGHGAVWNYPRGDMAYRQAKASASEHFHPDPAHTPPAAADAQKTPFGQSPRGAPGASSSDAVSPPPPPAVVAADDKAEIQAQVSALPSSLYAASTIRYAPADVALSVPGNLLPAAHALNFVDLNGPAFAAEQKAQVEMIYHHVQRLNMAANPFAAAGLPQAFTTAEALFSTLPFPIHAPQTLDRKED
ncbi:neuronal PAS domain-containing protein 3-like, partial [Amblyraja radiata]|uniref:neuronal PAS domain-containing protein 3-like n=1 Tax=Amblyraja radiata TaxID=386614 RepID=UPI001402B119